MPGSNSYATSILDHTWNRFVVGLGNGAKFLSRMFPPNIAPDKLALISDGMIESIQIAVLATFFGVLLSLPLGLAAARNLAPGWLSWSARGLIAVFRSFHPVIVSILFVKAVGGGGIGAPLFTAYQRFDYDVVLTILIAIILLILLAEMVSGRIRRIFL